MEKLITFWEELIETIPLMAFAFMGSFIQWVKTGHNGGLQGLIISSATAGFGSLCIGFLFSSFPQIPHGVTLFVCGMIGYSGGTLVDFMFDITKKKAEEIGEKITGEELSIDGEGEKEEKEKAE